MSVFHLFYLKLYYHNNNLWSKYKKYTETYLFSRIIQIVLQNNTLHSS
jgi:hypothetical protein